MVNKLKKDNTTSKKIEKKDKIIVKKMIKDDKKQDMKTMKKVINKCIRKGK